MKTLSEVLEILRAQGAQANYGRAFEVLVGNLLRGHPVWKDTFREVRLWGECGLGPDVGIDLVAEDTEGRLRHPGEGEGRSCVVQSRFMK